MVDKFCRGIENLYKLLHIVAMVMGILDKLLVYARVNKLKEKEWAVIIIAKTNRCKGK